MGGRKMKDATYTYTKDDHIVTIPRSLHNGRLDRVILAAVAQALSIEGLQEAAAYFADEVEKRKQPNALDAALEQKRNQKS
jgi:hypothetical protein